MKIIVDKQIIETENIYSITEIKEEKWNSEDGEVNGRIGCYSFEIKMYNDKNILIDAWVRSENHTDDEPSYFTKMTKQQNIERAEYYYNKIKKMHDGIVSVWSNNQTTIPKFEL